MFHVTEQEPQPWKTGPEVQVRDNALGKDPQKTGWLYQLDAPQVPGWVWQLQEAAGRKPPEHLDATRPVGQWNHVCLRVAPGGGEVAVNGVGYGRVKKGRLDQSGRGLPLRRFRLRPALGAEARRSHRQGDQREDPLERPADLRLRE